MNSSWNYRPTQDKLKVFVSSRIKECKDERLFVTNAIMSINHDPILFEHIGARAYSPRDLYLSRLSDSQVMVAIYRLGYGYIDKSGGMEISGLEDEYQFAKQGNIDTLFYVWQTDDEREFRLQQIIDEVTSGTNTVYFYGNSSELENKVKDDVTALITDIVIRTISRTEVSNEDSAEVIRKVKSKTGNFIERVDLLQSVISLLDSNAIVAITGVAGIGKTVLSAQLSENIDGEYIRLTGLAPKECYIALSNKLNPNEKPANSPFLNLESSRDLFSELWGKQRKKLLVIDECDHINEIIGAMYLGGGFTKDKKIIYTARIAPLDHSNVQIPNLTEDEHNRIIQGASDENSQYEETPLKTYQQITDANTFDSQFFKRAGTSAIEICKYLVLSPAPLTAEDLIELKNDSSYSISELTKDIMILGDIIEDAPNGYRVIHEDIANLLENDLKKSHQEYRFFAGRLLTKIERTGSKKHSYIVARKLGEDKANQYIDSAIRESAKLGDWHFGINLVNKLIDEAIGQESKIKSLKLMLSLVYPLELVGETNKADDILLRCKDIVKDLGINKFSLLIETETSSKARRAMLSEDIDSLKNIYDEYESQNKMWDRARIGLELSALYISAKQFDSAINILTPTLEAFTKLGDEYGIELSKRNMASTLSSIPGKEIEAGQLIDEISEKYKTKHDSRRIRAWQCNILSGKYRREKKYDEAEAAAKEAIAIAKDLGEEYLRALNTVNLGNVYRDIGRYEEAIESYNDASIISKACGRLDIESDASRLIAGIYNDSEIDGETENSKREKAKIFAQHSINLSLDTISHNSLAGAYWELGEALEALNDQNKATEAMFLSARHYNLSRDMDSSSKALVHAVFLSLPDHTDRYIVGISNYLEHEIPDNTKYRAEIFLDIFDSIISRCPKDALIRVLGLHLNVLWKNLPGIMRGRLLYQVINQLDFFSKSAPQSQTWRTLYSAIVIACMLKETKQPYLHYLLAQAATNKTKNLFVREAYDGSRVWTITLNLKTKVTVTIGILDDTSDSNLAAFCLSLFLSAFEKELFDFISSDINTEEVNVEIALFSEMPDDLKRSSTELGMSEAIEQTNCAITRPTSFSEPTPTIIFLGPSFLKDLSFGNDNEGLSLQMLFAKFLIELSYQLLQGEVDIDVIQPKIISLVRQASP